MNTHEMYVTRSAATDVRWAGGPRRGLLAAMVALIALGLLGALAAIGSGSIATVDEADAFLQEQVAVVDVAGAAGAIEAGDPRLEAVAVVDSTVVRVGAVDGSRAWHAHACEEFVMAIDGAVEVDYRDIDGDVHTVSLAEEQALTVPAHVSHRVRAADRASVLVLGDASAAGDTGAAE